MCLFNVQSSKEDHKSKSKSKFIKIAARDQKDEAKIVRKKCGKSNEAYHGKRRPLGEKV